MRDLLGDSNTALRPAYHHRGYNYYNAQARGVNSDYISVQKSIFSAIFIFFASFVACPLCVAVVVHAADRALRPETRNDRPLTEREKQIYHQVYLQDLGRLSDVCVDILWDIYGYFRRRKGAEGVGQAKSSQAQGDYVAAEYEPYTDADLYR